MESGNSFRFGINAQRGTRSVPLEIDLNETPLPSPREAFAGDAVFSAEATHGGSSVEARCGSCGRALSYQWGEWQRERTCAECESRNGRETRLRSGGVGLLDMNASPPREPDADEEGFFFGGESLGRQALEQNRDQNGGKRPIVHNTTFIGHSFIPPVTYANLLYSDNGYNFHTASRSGVEFQFQQRPSFDSSSKGSDLYSTLQAKLWATNYTLPNYVPHSASDVYLQALREYIFQRKGILGDGWHVKFDYCQSRRKTSVFYCGPDGSRFESMADVARHLQLETEDRVNGFALAHIGSYPIQRGKETSRSLRENIHRDCESSSRSRSFHIHFPQNDAPVPPGFEMVLQPKHSTSRSILDVDRSEDLEFGSQHFNDGFPVQFEDFFILSVGKIDPRPLYHNTSQIWPVAYRSSWHDKITGSLFLCEVSDGGEMGPIFKVRRCPCTTQSIPDGSTILSRPIVGSSDGEKVEKNDSAIGDLDDENVDIQMILEENIPPNLDDDILSCSTKNANENSDFQKAKFIHPPPQQLGQGDIGEFEVEGSSPSLVWEMATKTLLHACHEAYQQKGSLQFFCNHDMEGRDVIAPETLGSLSKFCYLAGPTNICRMIQRISDFDLCCKTLAKWLQQDRFGLDVEFVQEFIEQLPGVDSCSEYKFLNKRAHISNLQTVASGFLVRKRKSDVHSEKASNNFLRSCGRSRKDLCPLGKIITPNLPAYLIGDALQVWEFLQRFADVLGLEKHVPFQELESEFINPWLEKAYPLPHTIGRCTGAILRKAHSSLLKVLVGELSFKVALHVYPNIDDGMPIRGKKREMENSAFAKKIKLETLPINELTWPELARRYVLSVVAMEGNLESSEIAYREGAKVFHCLQGDGGTLGGSHTGVPAIEADALFLAEAAKQVFGSLKPKSDIYSIDIKESESNGASENSKVHEGEVPEWIEALEPVRKLPTNVGARIRNCVYEALRKNPPEWARDKLEHCISKDVYKGNASGPTKRAVVEVLGRVRKESPQLKPEKKENTKNNASTLSDVVVKQCRIVLRKAAAEDKKRAFCHRLGKTFLSPNESDDEGLLGYLGMVSRPLDLRTVDIRLAAGTYGVSLEAFLEDAREVWHNIRTAFRDDSEKLDLAELLSVRFEELYESEVLTLVNKVEESGYPNCATEEAKKEIDDILVRVSDITLPKAPWDDGVCKVCGMDRDDQSCLLCDVCDAEYHTYCLNPPLPRIPEGNWYCPTCVVAKVTYRNARGTQIINQRKKHIPREYIDNYLERLTKLAQSAEIKEYWEFTVEERIVLFKFLCDEALNTAVIRDHLDQCASLSSDLQQKLRTLNLERKNLMFKEELMAANAAKGRINTPNGEGETGGSIDAKLMVPQSNHGSCNGDLASSDRIPFDPVGPSKVDLNVPSVYLNISLKNEMSCLNDKIATLESELLKVQTRKDFMGRDSFGQAYWILSGPGICPQVVVNGSMTTSESAGKDPEEPNMMNPCSFIGYESDSEIGALVKWLREDDLTEREVRDSILQWQQHRPKGHKDAAEKDSSSSSSNGGKGLEASFLVTKAFTALEKKWRNEGRVYGCQCLEPLWHSRQHCLSCHQTFSGNEDLEMHRDTCSPFFPPHENIEVNQDSSKGKRAMTETQFEIWADEAKPIENENGFVFDKYKKDLECPFDFEEIKAKFVIDNSLKELVKDVGLIGSNGTPSFVPTLPPHVSDPMLSLVTMKNETNSCDDEPINLEDQQQQQKTRDNVAAGVNTDNISNSPSKYVENGTDEELSRVERSRFRSIKNKNAVLSSGKSRVLRECSLKPLVCRVSEILKLLKKNLLEMDAALPEDALRPSRINPEKRCMWRAFVKSAASIYEMSQATVLLEDMIKTEYLKKDWWYWSTPSAASNIATLSALALRIYTLDAAIFYEIPSSSSGPKKTPKKGRGNTTKSSSSGVFKDLDSDGAGSSRPMTRSSKRRKDSGG